MRSLLQASHELLIHDRLIGRPAWIDVIFPCVDSFPLSFIVVPSSPVRDLPLMLCDLVHTQTATRRLKSPLRSTLPGYASIPCLKRGLTALTFAFGQENRSLSMKQALANLTARGSLSQCCAFQRTEALRNLDQSMKLGSSLRRILRKAKKQLPGGDCRCVQQPHTTGPLPDSSLGPHRAKGSRTSPSRMQPFPHNPD